MQNTFFAAHFRGLLLLIGFALPGLPAWGQNSWINPGTGDWNNPANWSMGIPTGDQTAVLSNGGTAQISEDISGPFTLRIDDGAIELLAGDWTGTYDLVFGEAFLLAASNDSAALVPPTVTSPRFLIVGNSTASFHYIRGMTERLIEQQGGTLNVDTLEVLGTYDLSAGTLNVGFETFLNFESQFLLSGGSASMGTFHVSDSYLQTGGTYTAYATYLGGVDAIFRVEGGSASLGEVQVYEGATIEVAGGEVVAGRLFNPSSGPLGPGFVEVSSGTFALTNSIEPYSAPLDFLAGDWTLDVRTGFATLQNAHFADVSSATLKAGPETLVILPTGLSPAEFANTDIQGIVHTAGTPLEIPAGRVVKGTGVIDDLLVVNGEMYAQDIIHSDYHIAQIDANSGIQVGASGVANLVDGSITATDDESGIFGGELYAARLVVGLPGKPGAFTHASGLYGDGDQSTNKPEFLIGHQVGSVGTYTINDGVINIGDANIGTAGGTGAFIQNGGEVNIDLTSLHLGAPGPGLGGRYELNGGMLRSRTIDLLNEFTQTGGVHIADFADSTELRVGEPNGTGFYDLQGGTHIDRGRILVGSYPNSVGTYRIGNIGELDARRLYVRGGGTGKLMVEGGTLLVDDLQIGTSGDGNHQMEINNAASSITIRSSLVFGPNSTFNAVPGSEIHLGRASIGIQATDPQEFLGLNHTTLVFDGATGFISQLEVAGLDMGPTSEGFNGNFSLAGLVIGQDSPAQVRLVDQSNNHALLEALYVRELWIGPGSNLDLNGLNLYYGKLYMDASASVTLNGGVFQLQAVPEPATWAGMMATICLFACRSRQRWATKK